jgi:hypothetical protein
MSCPERQIANLMESVTEAIARSALDDSCLSRKELEEAAQAGISKAYPHSRIAANSRIQLRSGITILIVSTAAHSEQGHRE